ncbi:MULTISPECIES: hypothetical protein [Bacillus cereus group]|uniref:hypothetical protein n=1 Tax=Bacillus cereus group TaxID=86661 RepID=UPI0021571D8B
MELELFNTWLIEHRGMKEKSAKDVISRLNRVLKLIDLELDAFNREKVSYDKIVDSLIQSSEFMQFSGSVKSQLKRSIKLYEEYHFSNSKI